MLYTQLKKEWQLHKLASTADQGNTMRRHDQWIGPKADDGASSGIQNKFSPFFLPRLCITVLVTSVHAMGFWQSCSIQV
jgi:hypothetical protein